MALDIILNGKESTLENVSTLADLLVEIDIDPVSSRGVAVAINEEIVRRPDWNTRQLQSGDEVELVTARQGG